jgi:UDP-hydrolysing UDP-N-acetyl-D-glucosamine 2-epimerase
VNKRKVCVVITARPSYSRVKTAMQAIKNHSDLELQLILSGSVLLERYGDASKVIESDGFIVNEKIYNIIEGETPTSMAKTTGIAIMELANAFYNLKPDIVITIADRFETIATSIAASYQNIPLVHIQGGEVTGSIDEKVRHANTKFADIHFVASENARNRVIQMGEEESTVINTGCPSIDIARDTLEKPELNFDPIKKYGGVGAESNWLKGYVVVMQHSVTTEYESAKDQIYETLEAVHELDIPAFWFWPNVDAGSDGISNGIRKFRERNNLKNIHFFKNMVPEDFLRLIKNSKCLIGNSSVGIREAAFLGVPVVNIGSRQNSRERANNVIDCDYQKKEIKESTRRQFKHGHYECSLIYGDGYSGKNIANFLTKCELRFNKKITY